MLNLIDNADLLIDGVNEVIRHQEISHHYDDKYKDICRELDISADLNLKKLVFSFKLRYRSYPASLKKLDK